MLYRHPLAGTQVLSAAGGCGFLADPPTSMQTLGKFRELARRWITTTNGYHDHPFSSNSLFPDQPPARESNVV
jgi:hypothetical protein